ncbi:MAG: M48 family metallopeptidase [Methylophaga sp.]|nr:M48 family metallopeptidase [Methylophaga sp.]
MNYENPHIPEGINTSEEHPLKNFFILLIGSVVLIVTLSVVLAVSGGWLASKIPFSAENEIAGMYNVDEDVDDVNAPELTAYLQSLTDQISQAQNLPDEMKITAHYIDSDTVNAFATIGGHVFLFRGLLEKLPNENTLVTLLSHEIAHVKYRHPIKSLGSGILVGIAISTVTGSTNSDLLGSAGLLSSLKFGRDMEQQSDEEAMITLQALYGHLNGGTELFKIFQNMREEMDIDEPVELFSTHPLDEDRIANFTQVAKDKGWLEAGNVTPLPDFFEAALASSEYSDYDID